MDLDGEEGPYSTLTVANKCAWIDLATLLLVHGFNPNECQIYDLLHPLTCLEAQSRVTSEDCEIFIECLFLAGYRPKKTDERKLEEFISCHKDIISVEIQKLLEAFIQDKVKTLKQLCYLLIRSHFIAFCQGRSILNSISKLPIPKSIQDCVSYKTYLKTARIPDNSCFSPLVDNMFSSDHYCCSCCSFHKLLLTRTYSYTCIQTR